MISITGQTISISKGDSGVIEVTCYTDQTKTTPLDITGYTVLFIAGDDFAEAYAGLLIEKDNGANGGVAITNAAGGVYQIQFTPSWTNALTIKGYVYSTKIISPGGSVYTMASGPLVLLQTLPHA